MQQNYAESRRTHIIYNIIIIMQQNYAESRRTYI